MKGKKKSKRTVTKTKQSSTGKKKRKAAKRPLVYVKNSAARFDLPRYEGERYEATVPTHTTSTSEPVRCRTF